MQIVEEKSVRSSWNARSCGAFRVEVKKIQDGRSKHERDEGSKAERKGGLCNVVEPIPSIAPEGILGSVV